MVAGSTAIIYIPHCHQSGSRIVFQYVTVNNRFLLTIFKEGAGNGFLWLANLSSHLTNMPLVVRQSCADGTDDTTS
jgi:hypothetical protein